MPTPAFLDFMCSVWPIIGFQQLLFFLPLFSVVLLSRVQIRRRIVLNICNAPNRGRELIRKAPTKGQDRGVFTLSVLGEYVDFNDMIL